MNKTTTPIYTDQLRAAVALHQQGKLSEADALYQKILANHPNHFDALHFRGVIAKQNGQAPQAVKLIRQAISCIGDELNANHASAFCNLGAAYQDCQQTELALSSYQQAILLRPDYAMAHNNLGNTLKNLGRHQDAIEAYQVALRLSPNYAEAFFNAALALQHLQQHESALNFFERAIQIKPGYVDAYFALGNLYQSLKHHEKALHHFDQALALQPDFAKVWFNRGISLRRLANYEAAIRSFETAIQYQPGYANAYLYLANTLKTINRIPEAVSAFQRAMDCGGDAEQINFALAALGVGAIPPAPPAGYIKELFDQYADHFDAHLIGVLNYAIPTLLAELIETCRPQRKLNTLDLGCGTGLCASFLRPYSDRLCGVDLSQNMLDKAAQLNLYDQLVCADLTEFLSSSTEMVDLIIAADVLVYQGDLLPVFRAINHVLADQGLFAFSVEHGTQHTQPYQLTQSNRYAHTEQYLRQLAEQNGLSVIQISHHSGRLENQTHNQALVVLLQKLAVQARRDIETGPILDPTHH
ncbi:putative TPR repeat methyltransferase [Oxalobacteraceae bacterium GrIS 2.11]